MAVGPLQVGVAAVGSEVIIALPNASVAAQRPVDGHEILAMLPIPGPSILVGALQAGVATVGLVEMTTSPPNSLPATHNAVDAHEIAWR
jgi:hypothetical protein